MKPVSQAVGVARGIPKEGRQYATREEVERGLSELTDADYVKLMMIAKSFCRRRFLSNREMEAQELLSEAILKTLQLDDGKRWNKEISLIRHLDRAMENISGHLVGKLAKIVPFPENAHPSDHGNDDMAVQVSAEEALVTEEATQSLLKSVFGEDEVAADFFVKRYEGYSPVEIQEKLHLSGPEYETIARRVRRKVTIFTLQAKQ